MHDCERCLNSRVIVSENGRHKVCCLTQKKAIDCMIGKKSHFVSLYKDENKVTKD